jgi:hypothetical protein
MVLIARCLDVEGWLLASATSKILTSWRSLADVQDGGLSSRLAAIPRDVIRLQ